MITILTKAIIIIYSNGYIDSIEIDDDINHSEYYKKLIKVSEHFANLCSKYEIDTRYRFQFDRILMEAGAVVLSNWNLIEISRDRSFIYKQLPQFYVMLPENDITSEQAIALEQSFKDYPENNFLCNRYDKENKKFNPYNDGLFQMIERIKNTNISDESHKL